MEVRLNILFILVDALRPDMLTCYDPQGVATPNIDRLAEEGVLFRDAFSCINATDSSLMSIMTGLYPARHGIIHQGMFITSEEIAQARKVRLTSELLQEAGYRTLAIDWLGRWHRRGFDKYSGYLIKRNAISEFTRKIVYKAGLWGIAHLIMTSIGGEPLPVVKDYDDAQLVVNRAIEMVKDEHNEPFFLFLHFWDVHYPYIPPDRFVQVNGPLGGGERRLIASALAEINNPVWQQFTRRLARGYKYVDEVVALYRGEVAFVDEQLGRLWETLEKLGVMDETLIILTSDHGESLGEHGIYFDHHGLYDVTIRVPLILRYPPALPRGLQIKGFVQHVDLMPTMLELLGIEAPDSLDGRSLLPAISRGVADHRPLVYVEEANTQRKVALRTERYKYICAPSEKEAFCRYCGKIHGGVEELYDLARDPGETENLAETEPEVRRMLAEQLAKWQEALERKDASEPELPAVEIEFTEEEKRMVEERLRDLGYM
ncbi:MAG: sulfatase family protein, partial [Anaerolineae bacterium]